MRYGWVCIMVVNFSYILTPLHNWNSRNRKSTIHTTWQVITLPIQLIKELKERVFGCIKTSLSLRPQDCITETFIYITKTKSTQTRKYMPCRWEVYIIEDSRPRRVIVPHYLRLFFLWVFNNNCTSFIQSHRYKE